MKADRSGKVQLAQIIRDILKTNSLPAEQCAHLVQIQDVTPSAEGCEDCLKLGDEWVFLRLCLTCGYVGCCDNSKNKHATRHHHETKHPIIVSFEPQERWLWCYIDQLHFQL